MRVIPYLTLSDFNEIIVIHSIFIDSSHHMYHLEQLLVVSSNKTMINIVRSQLIESIFDLPVNLFHRAAIGFGKEEECVEEHKN